MKNETLLKGGRVAIYVRVSTKEQSTDMQLEALREYAEQRKWKIVAEFSETFSGAKDDRPKRKEILRLCQEKKIDLILVWKLDRWGRSMTDLVLTLQQVAALEIGFVSLTEHLDFTTPMGRLMVGLLAILAEFEREVIKERMWEGRKRYAEKHNGNMGGRKPTAMAKMKEVVMLVEGGMSKYETAKRLGISPSSVARILKQHGEQS